MFAFVFHICGGRRLAGMWANTDGDAARRAGSHTLKQKHKYLVLSQTHKQAAQKLEKNNK